MWVNSSRLSSVSATPAWQSRDGPSLLRNRSLYARRDSAGRETWYGHLRTNGRQVKKRIGPKRTEGTSDGLTRRQAEAELASDHQTRLRPRGGGERITIAELGRRYIAQLERQGRKKANARRGEQHPAELAGAVLRRAVARRSSPRTSWI